ncbi:MAG: hypothetical protein ACKOZM_08675, partial [Flavobacteriales bacterium]
MIPRLLWSLLLAACCLTASAQFNDNAGGRSSAMAGAYTALSDGWSVFHNQAGLNAVKTIDAGVYYENRFGLTALSDKGLFVAARLGKGVVAGSFHSFGYSQYASSKGGISYAMGLGEKLDVGVQLNYYTILLGENYGRAQAVSAEGGFIYRLNNKLTLDGHISNPKGDPVAPATPADSHPTRPAAAQPGQVQRGQQDAVPQQRQQEGGHSGGHDVAGKGIE